MGEDFSELHLDKKRRVPILAEVMHVNRFFRGCTVKRAGGIVPLFLILIFSLVLSVAEGASASPSIDVRSDGMAIISENNTAKAREEAVNDALAKAVEQALPTVVSWETIAQNYQLLSEQVFSYASQYIQNYRIVSEKVIGNFYQVSIEATVSEENLKEHLFMLGLMEEEGAGIMETVTFEMTISGIDSYRSFIDFREMIASRIEGVKSVQEKGFGSGVAYLEVTVRGSIRELADRLTLMDYGDFTVDILEITDKSLKVQLRRQD